MTKPRNFPERKRERQVRAWQRSLFPDQIPDAEVPQPLAVNRRSIKTKKEGKRQRFARVKKGAAE